MPEQTRSYVAIDLKSFYASVECKERNLDPLTTNLVVADPERTTKTICLAVSPALKAYGIPGRARLFEVVRKVKEINDERKRKNGGHEFTGQSCDTGKSMSRPGLRRQLELVRICIWRRLRWISWQSIANRMRMISGLQVWMR